MKKIIKRIVEIFQDDRFQPYIYSLILCVIWGSIFTNLWVNIDTEKSSDFSNTIVTIISIFTWFLWVALSIFQTNQSSAINFLKENGMFCLLLRYFKEALVFSLATIFIALVSSMVGYSPVLYIAMVILFVVSICLNGRVIKFMFKVLEK